MHTFRLVLLVASLVLVVGVLGHLVSSMVGVDPRVGALGLMLVAYAIVWALVELQRRRIARELTQLTPEEREFLGRMEPEIRYTRQMDDVSSAPSARVATWVGLFWVNGPTIPLLVGPLGIRQFLYGQHDDWRSALLLALGFGLAWCWWSVNVTLWKRWARRRGVDMNELQWRAENSIVWPRGHFFERTELGHVVAWLRSRRHG